MKAKDEDTRVLEEMVPEEFRDFSDVFSKMAAARLPE